MKYNFKSKSSVLKWLNGIDPGLSHNPNNLIDDVVRYKTDFFRTNIIKNPKLLFAFFYRSDTLQEKHNLNVDKMTYLTDLLCLLDPSKFSIYKNKIQIDEIIQHQIQNVKNLSDLKICLHSLYCYNETNQCTELHHIANIAMFLDSINEFNTFEKQLLYLMDLYLYAYRNVQDSFTFVPTIPIPLEFPTNEVIEAIKSDMTSFLCLYLHSILKTYIQYRLISNQ